MSILGECKDNSERVLPYIIIFSILLIFTAYSCNPFPAVNSFIGIKNDNPIEEAVENIIEEVIENTLDIDIDLDLTPDDRSSLSNMHIV